MNATSTSVRIVFAALSLALGIGLAGAKVHYTDRFARLTAQHEVVVLPHVEVVAGRAQVAAAPLVQPVQ